MRKGKRELKKLLVESKNEPDEAREETRWSRRSKTREQDHPAWDRRGREPHREETPWSRRSETREQDHPAWDR